MKKFKLLDIILRLFDGEGGAAAPAGESGAQGETQAPSGSTRRGKSGEYSNVKFGKQPSEATAEATEPSAAEKGKEPDVKVTSNTLEERRKAFREMVSGEYKDIYTEETQRIIDRRFREAKNLEQQNAKNQPIIDMLMQRYKIGDGDMDKLTSAIENDDVYWNEAAMEAGMSIEQFKQFKKLERENEALKQSQRRVQSDQQAQQRLQQWYSEGEQLKSIYPDFDLDRESNNKQFMQLLGAGVPVRHAYEVAHMDEIKDGIAQATAKRTEKQVVDGIRAKGSRPAENGTSSQSAFTVKDDVSKLTKKDREEIALRAARGEIIYF